MVYSNKFVCAVKVAGKVLKEFDGSVAIPFGQEYSLLLKNLNSRRAMAKVSIDGTEVTSGWLVIGANDSLELERSILNNNLNKGNRFKFVERTSSIEKHRGIKADDGLIRVEYKFEKERIELPEVVHYPVYTPDPQPYYPRPYYPKWPNYTISCNNSNTATMGSPTRSLGGYVRDSASASLGRTAAGAGLSFQSTSMAAMNCSVQTQSNDGITVPGRESTQSFTTVSGFDTEASHVIVLKLRGDVNGKPVLAAVTTHHKLICEYCGTTNKSSDKFCGECGAAVSII